MYIDEEIYHIEGGDQILVPAGTKHKIKNTGKNPLVLVFTYPSVKVTRTLIEYSKIAKNLFNLNKDRPYQLRQTQLIPGRPRINAGNW